LDSARQYGLVSGGPKVIVERCEDILRRGAKRRIKPIRSNVDRFIKSLCVSADPADWPEDSRVQEFPVSDDSLPKLRDLKGIAPRCTGKTSAVEYVRRLRDATDN